MSDFEDDEEEWRPPTEAEMKVLGKHIANNISYIAFPRNLCLFSMVVLGKYYAFTLLFQDTCLFFPCSSW